MLEKQLRRNLRYRYSTLQQLLLRARSRSLDRVDDIDRERVDNCIGALELRFDRVLHLCSAKVRFISYFLYRCLQEQDDDEQCAAARAARL
jgi:hypothetical protein